MTEKINKLELAIVIVATIAIAIAMFLYPDSPHHAKPVVVDGAIGSTINR